MITDSDLRELADLLALWSGGGADQRKRGPDLQKTKDFPNWN